MTEPRRYLSEDAIAEINETLNGLRKGQVVTIVYYGDYEQKYLQLTGPVTKVDSYWNSIQIGNVIISFPEITQLLTDICIRRSPAAAGAVVNGSSAVTAAAV